MVIYSLPKGGSNSKNYAMTIYIYLKNPARSDIDNYAKPIIDCCVKKGIIRDDRYIKYLELIKKQAKEDGFEIIITSVKED